MIIAGRRGGQVVKALVKILEAGCSSALALRRMFAGTDAGLSHGTNTAM